MTPFSQLAANVFAVPSLLSADSIQRILTSNGRAPLQFCGPGSGDHWGHGGIDYEEHEQKKKKKYGPHQDPKKPHDLPDIAQKLWDGVRNLPYQGGRALAVDQHMKYYRLREGHGIVAPHTDLDFPGPLASVARYSLLVYLNDDFDGGETVFSGSVAAPHLATGSGLLFRHDVLHEGRRVLRGTKHVLKTDVFVMT